MALEPIRFRTRLPEFGHRCEPIVGTRLLCEFFVPERLRRDSKFQG
jgi:hypothetical protein